MINNGGVKGIDGGIMGEILTPLGRNNAGGLQAFFPGFVLCSTLFSCSCLERIIFLVRLFEEILLKGNLEKNAAQFFQLYSFNFFCKLRQHFPIQI